MGQVSCQTLLRLISGIVGLTYGSVGMVLWSGVGDAALSSHTAYTLYIGANAMAAFLVLQRVRLYDQKITTLRVLIVINLITLRTIDQQWWLLVTAPSLNLLLGSCILMMTATLAVCGKMGDRSDSGLDAVVGAVVWILSLQLQPLPIDPEDYIRSTLMVVIVAVWSPCACLKPLVMLVWSMYCLRYVLWDVQSPFWGPLLPDSMVAALQKRSSDTVWQIVVTIACTLVSTISAGVFAWYGRQQIGITIRRIGSGFGRDNRTSPDGDSSPGRLEGGLGSRESENDVAPSGDLEHSGRPPPSPNILGRVWKNVAKVPSQLFAKASTVLQQIRRPPRDDDDIALPDLERGEGVPDNEGRAGGYTNRSPLSPGNDNVSGAARDAAITAGENQVDLASSQASLPAEIDRGDGDESFKVVNEIERIVGGEEGATKSSASGQSASQKPTTEIRQHLDPRVDSDGGIQGTDQCVRVLRPTATWS
ncbi:hypothetical protein DPSP01_003978 [Paraphaeosphaeria sporulosa]